MKPTWIAGALALLLAPVLAVQAQDAPAPLPDAPVSAPSPTGTGADGRQPPLHPASAPSLPGGMGQGQSAGAASAFQGKLHDYLAVTFLSPAVLTAPAFRAGLRMANPPSRGEFTYPGDWRQGAQGFGRNFGDAFADRVSTRTARFLTGAMARENLRYQPSGDHNPLARTFYAIGFTFVDRSDSGHRMPALSNFAGAAAGGAVGLAYLPPGFDNLGNAGRRAAVDLGALGGTNLLREFAPRIPGPVREFLLLIGR